MSKLVLSEKYGIAAAIGLLLLTALNSATLMLVGSVLGLVAGIWVIRQGDARRVAAVERRQAVAAPHAPVQARLRPQRVEVDGGAHGASGSFLPGFMMPAGSSSCLMARIRPRLAPCSRSM